ncbi:hypothetical protein D3C71_24140 [compost metagenome]
MHQLAVWTPKWTPEMQQLRTEVNAAMASLSLEEGALHTAMARDELASKAARFDVFKRLGELACGEPGGGVRVDDRLFATFEEAYDTLMREALEAANQKATPDS